MHLISGVSVKKKEWRARYFPLFFFYFSHWWDHKLHQFAGYDLWPAEGSQVEKLTICERMWSRDLVVCPSVCSYFERFARTITARKLRLEITSLIIIWTPWFGMLDIRIEEVVDQTQTRVSTVQHVLWICRCGAEWLTKFYLPKLFVTNGYL